MINLLLLPFRNIKNGKENAKRTAMEEAKVLTLMDILGAIDGALTQYWLTWILLLVAVFFSIKLKFPQLFVMRDAVKVLTEKDENAKGNKEHISPFEAVTISLGTRVGVGSIVGVAVAIATGGPGSIFWMWVMAFMAGASSFAECTLGQVYKAKDGDKAFKGGPAFYIRKGLKSKAFSIIFAVCLIAVGWTFNSLYSNTAVDSFSAYFANREAFNDSHLAIYVGLAITVFACIMFFGGGPFIAKFTRVVTPFLAFTYILLTLIVILRHLGYIPDVLGDIFRNAFDFKAAAGGVAGQMVFIGIQRALFATEAGLGSAPNAAASAHTSHPVKQGIAQSFIVFLDIVICTCSAFFVLFYIHSTGVEIKIKDFGAGMKLMQDVMKHFYSFGDIPIGQYYFTALIVILASTVSVGSYYCGQMNIKYLTDSKAILFVYRVISVAVIFIGTQVAVAAVWVSANITMTLICTVNLVAIVLLCKVVVKCLHDYKEQTAKGLNPTFDPKKLGIENTECWDKK